MTANDIENTIRTAFKALYPTANIVIRGAGEEEILVAVQHGTDYIQTFECEIPSDDDGYFHFHLDGADLVILVAYPEA